MTGKYKYTGDCHVNRIGGVMVRVFPTSAVHRGFGLRLSQTKDYAIDLCCISTRQTTLSLFRSGSE